MTPAIPIRHDIVLLGAGHAHVEVLRRFALRPAPGVRLTLVGREPHTPYSGMLPGLIRGDYGFDQAHIDLAPLAGAARARLILAESRGIDLTARTVALTGRPALPFDTLSIDVGGEPAVPPGGGTPVKPIGQFLHRLEQLEGTLPPGARLAIIGAGPAGTELALALARRFGARMRLVLIGEGPEPLADAPAAARRVARAALVEAGVELVNGVRAGALADGRLTLSDGSFIDAEAALWATGVIGPGFLAASGLACDEAGCVRVDAGLRSVSHPFVFAAGDCAAIEGAPRPKAGVWAVRAGVPLAANLRRAAAGRPPLPWRPQSQALTILGLGGDRAVAWRNGIAVSGALIWRWKDWIDRRWMRMYAMRMAPDPSDPMRCGGCGAKVGAAALADMLARVAPATRPDIPLGLEGAGRRRDHRPAARPGGGAERGSVPRLSRRPVRVRPDRRRARALRHPRHGRAALDGARRRRYPLRAGRADGGRSRRHDAGCGRGAGGGGLRIDRRPFRRRCRGRARLRRHRADRAAPGLAQVRPARGRRAGADQADRHRGRARRAHARARQGALARRRPSTRCAAPTPTPPRSCARTAPPPRPT